MKLEHIVGRINHIEKEYIKQLKYEPENFNEWIEQEESYRHMYLDVLFFYKKLRKKHKLEKQKIEKANDILQKIDGGYRTASQKIINYLNDNYSTTLNVEDIIQEHKDYYYENGIMNTLRDYKIIHKVFHKTMVDLIPSHPKDEYPKARQVKRKFIIHAGPTNSGKTYSSIEKLKTAKCGVYLSPLRLLAYEIFDTLNDNNVICNLTTGEEEILFPNATVVSCTIEKANLHQEYDIAVIDEGQLISDKQRGFAWTKSILGLIAKEIHICCAPHVVSLIKQIIKDCGDNCEVIYHERQTELIMEKKPLNFPKDIQKGDALIVFSRKAALQVASYLEQNQIKSSIIYGNLPPETRKKQVNLFLDKTTDVIVATDAIGMGLNLPIRRVIFLEQEKFDGIQRRMLNIQEIKQIAGRAGRRNIYDEGFVNTLSHSKVIRNAISVTEDTINCGYILPLDQTIVNFPFGTLKERFEAWDSYPLNVHYFQKNDITHIYDLIKASEEFENDLSISDLLKAINIPFNYKDNVILNLWKAYLQLLVDNEDIITKPQFPKKRDLSNLESYYKQLDLYYSFGTVFNKTIDNEWLRQEKHNIANEIHEMLVNQLETHQKKCRSCGRELKWDFIYNICDNCHKSSWY